MDEHLEQQLINEIRAALQLINQNYKDFFHINLITLCDMKDMKCTECADSSQQCKRCVIGFSEPLQLKYDMLRESCNSADEIRFLMRDENDSLKIEIGDLSKKIEILEEELNECRSTSITR